MRYHNFYDVLNPSVSQQNVQFVQDTLPERAQRAVPGSPRPWVQTNKPFVPWVSSHATSDW